MQQFYRELVDSINNVMGNEDVQARKNVLQSTVDSIIGKNGVDESLKFKAQVTKMGLDANEGRPIGRIQSWIREELRGFKENLERLAGPGDVEMAQGGRKRKKTKKTRKSRRYTRRR